MQTYPVIAVMVATMALDGCTRQSPGKETFTAPGSGLPNMNSALNVLSALPPAVQRLRADIQGKTSEEGRRILIERFGPAHRVVGSGFMIEQWDVENGVLTFHPGGGAFFTPQGQNTIHLLDSRNPVELNLLGSYEMFTLDTDTCGGCWLGNLHVHSDFTYEYVDSRAFPEMSALQTNNFFYLHPVGTFSIQYAEGFSGDTLLETLATERVVAWLHFNAAGGRAGQTFMISTNERGRRLVFGSSLPLSFRMDKGWMNGGWKRE